MYNNKFSNKMGKQGSMESYLSKGSHHLTLWRWLFVTFIICWSLFGTILQEASTSYASGSMNQVVSPMKGQAISAQLLSPQTQLPTANLNSNSLKAKSFNEDTGLAKNSNLPQGSSSSLSYDSINAAPLSQTPALSVSSNVLNFSSNYVTKTPASQNITLTATGGGVSYRQGGIVNFYNVSAPNGEVEPNSPSVITISLRNNLQNFSPGTYTNTLSFIDTNNSSDVVTVTITLTMIPQLVVDNSVLNFSSSLSQTYSMWQSFILASPYITWTTNISYGVGASNWLTLSQTSGTGLHFQNIFVTSTVTNIPSGTYTATITFQDTSNPLDQTSINVNCVVGVWNNYFRNNRQVYAEALDNSGNIWFGTSGGAIWEFTGANWITYTQIPFYGLVQTIAVDSNDNKWFGTQSGVYELSGTNWITYTTSNSGLINNTVTAIAIDNSGNKWFGTSGGVSEFNGTNWITYTTSNSGLITNTIQTIAIDGSGNKWFGTFGGVNEFNGTNWITYTTSNSGLINNTVTAIAIDNSGNKWFGTSGGVSEFNGTNWSNFNSLPSYYPYNAFGGSSDSLNDFYLNVSSIAIDKYNNIWFGLYTYHTGSGIVEFDGTNWITYSHNNSDLAILTNFNKVAAIVIDKNNNKWLGFGGGGQYTNNGIIELQSGNTTHFNLSSPQNVTAGKNFTDTVSAFDAFNNVPTSYTGTVHFTSTDPQASLPNDYTFTANDGGVHVFSFTFRTAGIQSIQAVDTSNNSIIGSVTFNVNSANPASIVTISGTPQSTPTYLGFPLPFVIQAKDLYNNPVSGTIVTFQAPASGASGTFTNGLNSLTLTANASGTVTSSIFTANTITGNYTVTANATGVGVPASFILTNTVGGPTQVLPITGTPQNTIVSSPFTMPVVAKVLDKNGSPLSGVNVNFIVTSLPGSQAGGTFPSGAISVSIATDSNGNATTPTLTANGNSGGFMVKAFVSGVITPAIFSFNNYLALPPDPTTVVPPLDTSVATTMISETSFLYSLPNNPIQTGVNPGTISPTRVSVIRGRVFFSDGQTPLPGVKITILNHPEYGYTYSRLDGWFDLAVNGGGAFTIVYQMAGFLEAEHQVQTAWEQFAMAPITSLVEYDPNVNSIQLGSSVTQMQIAKGSLISDTSGTRQAVLLFPPNETFTATTSSGSSTEFTSGSVNVRATEYTVGSNGPNNMPGTLPVNSGYTYAADFSIDEAVNLGANKVTFSQPVVEYTPNFLNFPLAITVTGGASIPMSIPVGYYDQSAGQWVESGVGRVIQIASISGGLANLYVDNSGGVATSAQLAALGITTAEQQALATLYQPGQSVWRVTLSHFSTWDFSAHALAPQITKLDNGNQQPYDFNVGYGPPDGAKGPHLPGVDDGESDFVCKICSGSKIDAVKQSLGEDIGLIGTSVGLHYQSEETSDHNKGLSTVIPLTLSDMPTSLQSVSLNIYVAGREFNQVFNSPTPNMSTPFSWDGKDAYGQVLQGPQNMVVSIGYTYQGHYLAPSENPLYTDPNYDQEFGHFSYYGMPATTDPSRQTITIFQDEVAKISGASAAASDDLGGWKIDVHHFYDPQAKILYEGDGTIRSVQAVPIEMTVAAGNGTSDNLGDGGLASNSSVSASAIASGPDGSIYIAGGYPSVIRKISPNGIITTIAGGGTPADHLGDDGPATSAQLNNPYALTIDRDGNIYVADSGSNRIRKITAATGIITTVAGNSPIYCDSRGCDFTGGDSGDDQPATQALLNNPTDIAIGPDGSIYIADSNNNRVRRVDANGIISEVAGAGNSCSASVTCYTGDGHPANATQMRVYGIAIGPRGDLFVAGGNVVRQIALDGTVTTVAGNGTNGYSGDGGLATNAQIYDVHRLTVSASGTLYLVDSYNNRIRAVDSTGNISTIAGNGSYTSNTKDAIATKTGLNEPNGLTLSPDGSIYIAQNNYIQKMTDALPGFTGSDITIPSEDGSELYHFDQYGRHLNTVDAYTGAVIYSFGYDGHGHLSTVTDAYSNTTTIQRDGSGKPTAIIAPFNQQTTLVLDANNYLQRVTDPLNNSVTMTYTGGGLLTGLQEPNGGQHTYSYDSNSRLYKDQEPDGSFTQLDRGETFTNSTHTVIITSTSAMGRTGVIQIQRYSNGAEWELTTDSNGIQSGSFTNVNGDQTITSTDGTVATVQQTPDPRWGLRVPYASSQTTTSPGGTVSTVTSNIQAQLSDPSNPLSSLQMLTSTVTVNGSASVTTTIDPVALLITTTTTGGRQTITKLDHNSNPLTVQSPGLAPTNYTYDSFGRVTKEVEGVGDTNDRTTTYTYNSITGYLDSVTDPIQRTTNYTYDNDGRVTNVSFADGSVITTTYDNDSNVTSITPPGKTAHNFGFDTSDRPTTYTAPTVSNGGTNQVSYAYNADSQTTSFTLPDNQTIALGYDSGGRLITTTVPSVGDYVNVYDSVGRLYKAVSPYGNNRTSTFDGVNLLSVTLDGQVQGSLGYAYNNFNKLTSDTVTNTTDSSISTVNYQYDPDGLMTQAGDLTLYHVGYSGQLTGTSISDVATSEDYNEFGETQDFNATGGVGASLYQVSYQRDKLGRVIQKAETVGSDTPLTYTYGYDAVGQLTDVAVNNVPTYHYNYDLNGNRISYGDLVHNITTTASYDAQDRLVSYGNTNYNFNADGDLISKQISGTSNATNYSYDALGNLTSATISNSTTVTNITYVLDNAQRRIGKEVNGLMQQEFIYADQIHPLAWLDGGGRTLGRFVYGGDGNVPSYMLKDGHTYRFVTDQVGSVRLVVDADSGAVVEHLDYDSWGNVINDTNPGFQPFGYAGGLYDRDTGLVHFGMRDYDPQTGRWTTKDHQGFGAGSNFYVYVGNDPINDSDPSGACDQAAAADAAAENFVVGMCDAASFGFCSLIAHGIAQMSGHVDPTGQCPIAYKCGQIGGMAAAWMTGDGEAETLESGVSDAAGIGNDAKDIANGDNAVDDASTIENETGSIPEGATCSFSYPTQVAIDPQGDTKSIGSLQVGDKVWAYDPDTGTSGYYTITAVLVHLDSAEEELSVDNNSTPLTTTPEHPFFTLERGFTPASQLWIGAHIRKADGSFGLVTALSIEQKPEVMYNLTVDHAHTFYVGADHLLVHNTCNIRMGAVHEDTLAKGVHIHVGNDNVELTVLPTHNGGIIFSPAYSKYSSGQIKNAINEANKALGDVNFRNDLFNYAQRVRDYSSGVGWQGRAVEAHFVMVGLKKLGL